MSYIFYVMIKCLILTILIEVLSAYFLGIKNKKDIIYVILANIVTNPIVVSFPLLIASLSNVFYSRIVTLFLEIITFLIEGYIYKKYFKYKRINPFIISLILNLCSFLLGLIIVR